MGFLPHAHRIRAAIFDIDGTLLDSMTMWDRITYDYAEKKGVQAPPDLSRIMNRLSNEQCARYYKQLGVVGTEEEILREVMEMAAERYRLHVPEIPGAAEFLKALHARGIRCAVATAGDLQTARPALERLHMLPYIDVLESCANIGRSKESPDIYLKCAADFGAAPHECVVFEDAPHAAQTAKNAGFAVVGILDAVLDEEGRRALHAASDRCIKDFRALLTELLPPEDTEN